MRFRAVQIRGKTLTLHFRPSTAAVLVLILYTTFTFIRLYKSDGDISQFITAGDYFVDSTKTPSKISVLENSVGYDGEFYYRLALDPFTQRIEDFGVRFDNPAFRQQRIGYPLLVWGLSFGNKAAIPALMVIVNLIALCGIAYFGALFARQYQRSALWGTLIAIYPGFMMSFGRNLAEIVTAFWILAGLYAAQRKLFLTAAFIFTLAMFTRETSLLVPGGVGVFLFYRYLKEGGSLRTNPWHLMLIPLFFHFLWSTFLSRHWNMPPISGGTQDLGIPFHGIIKFIHKNIAETTLLAKVNLFFLLFCISIAGIAAFIFKSAKADYYLKISWALYAVLLITLSDVIWLSFSEFMRAYTEFFLLSVLLIISSQLFKQYMNVFIGAYVAFSWIIMSLFFYRN